MRLAVGFRLLGLVALLGGDALAQGTCIGTGCACTASGCTCPAGCAFTCSSVERCLFESDAGSTVQCVGGSRCDLVLGSNADLTCTTTDRCRGELGPAAVVACSGTGECSLGLGENTRVECQPSTFTGRCEMFCRASCLLRCTPIAGGDCRLFCADGGAPTACGSGAFVGCEAGCGLLDGGAAGDAGATDAGPRDGGSGDAGPADGGMRDAGGVVDGGRGDAGVADADGGLVDGGAEADAGQLGQPPSTYRVGCSCNGLGGGAFGLLLLVLLARGLLRRG